MSSTGHLEAQVQEVLNEHVNNLLNGRGRLAGLAWSPQMPDDDPDAELLVVDANGAEYVLEVEVFLAARTPDTVVELPA